MELVRERLHSLASGPHLGHKELSDLCFVLMVPYLHGTISEAESKPVWKAVRNYANALDNAKPSLTVTTAHKELVREIAAMLSQQPKGKTAQSKSARLARQ